MAAREMDPPWAAWPALLLGLCALAGGAGLLTAALLGMQPEAVWRFLLLGAAFILLAWSIARARYQSLILYALVLTALAIWALWDTGLDLNALARRLVAPVLFGVLLALSARQIDRGEVLGRRLPLAVAAGLTLLFAVLVWGLLQPDTGLPPESLSR